MHEKIIKYKMVWCLIIYSAHVHINWGIETHFLFLNPLYLHKIMCSLSGHTLKIVLALPKGTARPIVDLPP